MYCIKINCILVMLCILDVFGDNYKLGDFCNLGSCGHKHIACNYRQGQKGLRCKGKVGNIIFNADLQQLLLKLHNNERNRVAKGLAEDLKPAVRMAAMSWDEMLYIFATIKAVSCSLRPDKCHPTDIFKYSGQNIGRYDYPGGFLSVQRAIAITEIFKKWLYPKEQRITQEIIDNFPESMLNTTMNSYALILNQRNTHIGCGGAWIERPNNYSRILLVCNYATRNFAGSKIYKSGKTASECQTGVHTENKWFGLCSVLEKYRYKP